MGLQAITDAEYLATTTSALPPTPVIPVSQQSNWQTANDNADQADNGGSTIVGADIASSNPVPIVVNGQATAALVRLKYAASSAPTTNPVIQVFGYDASGTPHLLVDAEGHAALELAVAATTDVQHAESGTTFAYTTAVEVDMNGCKQYAVFVRTAGAGGTIATAVIETRVI